VRDLEAEIARLAETDQRAAEARERVADLTADLEREAGARRAAEARAAHMEELRAELQVARAEERRARFELVRVRATLDAVRDALTDDAAGSSHG
jgi:chromosome segregation ATPase